MTLLVTWLWQGTAVAAFTTLLVKVVPPQAAARRHLVWWFALVLVVAIPLAELLPWLVGLWATDETLPSIVGISAEPESAPAALLLQSPPARVMALAAAAWALAAAIGAVRLGLGWAAIRRVAASATPLGPREHELPFWSRARVTGRRPRLRVSPRVRGACAIGLRRPTIVVSSDVAAALNDEQLEHVVLHELAHLQRYDDWSTLAQRLVVTLAWFHPAVHWIARHLDLEMEAACDERVVAQTGDAAEYGRSLLDVAALGPGSSSSLPLVAPGSSAHMPMLRARIERLAAARRRPHALLAALASSACVTLLACTVIAAGTMPALVDFESRELAPAPVVESPRLMNPVEPVRVVRPARTIVAASAPPVDTGVRSARRASATAADEGAAQRPNPQPAVESSMLSTAVPDAVTAGVDAPLPDAAPEPLAGRAIPPAWQAPRIAAGGPAPSAPGGNVAQRSAAGITRAALSTAGAFTRFGQALAARF